MKKLLLISMIAMATMFGSCNKNREETSYTVINSATDFYSNTAFIYEYNSEDVRIDSNIVRNPVYLMEYTFKPHEGATHIKIRVDSDENTFRWGSKIYFLEEGKNIRISIGLTTGYAFEEPML